MENFCLFLNSFLNYLLLFAIMVVIMIGGGVVGKKLRDNKDKKDAAMEPAGDETASQEKM